MPKKLSDNQIKEIIESFTNGINIEVLSEKYNCTKMTISRHLKKGVGEKKFKKIIKNKKIDKVAIVSYTNSRMDSNSETLEEEFNKTNQFKDSTFIELTPLGIEIDKNEQKDLSSISISEIEFPKIVFIIVGKKIELETKLLKDYPDWQFLSESDLERLTIEIFYDIKIAKRFCSNEQKVIKVPNTNVFKLVAPILASRGISRIVSPDKLISL